MSNIFAVGYTGGPLSVTGDLNMNANRILNIGNAGTDFLANGGLTLANALTVTTGGATVTAGGLTVTAGGVTVTAGGLRVTAGNLGLGAAAEASIGVYAVGAILSGSTVQSSASFGATIGSAATSQARGVYAGIVTAAAAFTVINAYTYLADAPSLGAGSSITTIDGLRVENQGAANVTNAYGVRIAAQSGASGVNMPLHVVSGIVGIGDTSHAGMTTGLVVNQGEADNHILALKSSDVATGLTSIVLGTDVETDDFLTINKTNPTGGGAWIQVLGTTGQATPFALDTWGGAPATTDTSGSLAAQNFFVGQHDGANADVDMAADSNAFAWGEIDSSNARLTRMLLKADDGELHLGNTTLVALDTEDDVMLVRALQRETSGGRGILPTLYDPENPMQDYQKLRELGLVGEKDAEGFYLFPLQKRLALYEGAIWQTYTRMMTLVDAIKSAASLDDLKAHPALNPA